MCGIAGMVTEHPSKEILTRMTNSIKHRGPDDWGIYIDKNVGLGSRRLSIIDLSKAGHQPMSNEDNSIWVVFNGEIYNYIEIRKELKKHTFKSKTDTEVILHAYEEWGEDCLQKFNGMFAFVIWDSKKNKIFCARDRLGIKPFFYYKDENRFLFGSEIKVLLAAGIPIRPNEKMIYDYLIFGYYDHTPETFFDSVMQLPQGHYMIFEDGHLKIKEYWDVSKRVQELNLSDNEYVKKFVELFKDSIRLRLRSDVPIGVNLSGGLDSPSLVMVVNEFLKLKGELQTFSMCFDDKRYDEREYIEESVKVLKCTPNFSYLHPEEVFKYVDAAVWHQEQPFGGIPTIAYWKMNELAKAKKVTVLLEGQGGDELFAGYLYFYGAFIEDMLNSKDQKRLSYEMEQYKKINKLSDSELKSFMDTVVVVSHGHTSQDASGFLYPDCISAEFKKKFKHEINFERPFDSNLLNMQYRDLKFTKLPRVLRFNDRASMAFSRELRLPYLDYRIVEFAFSLPDKQKIRDGINKFLLRRAMEGILPEVIRKRPKVSVVTPQTVWFRTKLKKDIEKILDSKTFANRKYFDVDGVGKEFDKFCRDDKPANSFFFWQCVNLELWLRKFIDKY